VFVTVKKIPAFSSNLAESTTNTLAYWAKTSLMTKSFKPLTACACAIKLFFSITADEAK
jgi:hypothetical protein